MEQTSILEMEDGKQRIEELVSLLNAASEAYYGGLDAHMTDYEWDAAFDELAALEAETGYILPNSPTQSVSFAEGENPSAQKEPHEYPALSLAKTKKTEEVAALTAFLISDEASYITGEVIKVDGGLAI